MNIIKNIDKTNYFKWKFWKRSTFERAKYLGKSNPQEGKDILETRAKPNWGKRKDSVKKIVG